MKHGHSSMNYLSLTFCPLIMLDNIHFAARLAYNAKKAFLNADSQFFRSEQDIPCHRFMLQRDITTLERILSFPASCTGLEKNIPPRMTTTGSPISMT